MSLTCPTGHLGTWMPKLHRAIFTLCCLLWLAATVGFVSSWWHVLLFDVYHNEHTTLGFHSSQGRIHLSHTYRRSPAGPASTSTTLSDDELAAKLEEINAEMASGATETHALKTNHREWLMFDYHSREMPVTWLGGGSIRSLTIPYWFLIMLFGLWPATVIKQSFRNRKRPLPLTDDARNGK